MVVEASYNDPHFCGCCHLTFPIYFTHHSIKVAAMKPRAFASATTAPAWVRDQQTAELYSVFHALRQGFQRGILHICIITDNMGTYYTLSSGKISARHCPRRLFYQFRGHAQVMWVPTSQNLADPFSRSLTPPLPNPCDFHILPYLSNCRTLTRFWWHS